MRNLFRPLLALLVTAVLAAGACAQETPTKSEEFPPELEHLGNTGAITQIMSGLFGIDMGGAGFDKMILLDQPSVQQELQMTEKQIAQVKEKMEQLPGLAIKPENVDPSNPLKALEGLASMGKTMDNMLATVLRTAQIKRLKEITLQQRGTQAFADPEVQSQLSLTASQKQQIATILGESSQGIKDMFQKAIAEGAMAEVGAMPAGAGPAGAGTGGGSSFKMSVNAKAGKNAAPKSEAETKEELEKFVGMFTGTEERLMAVLTKSQNDKWQRMRGQPFKFNLIEQAMKERKPADVKSAPDTPEESVDAPLVHSAPEVH